MRRTLGWSATAIVAATMAAATGCAARNATSPPRQAALSAGASSTVTSSEAAAPAAVRLSGAMFNEDSDGARVVLSADAPLLYTSYEPRPDLLVVDLPGTETGKNFAPPRDLGTLVSAIRFEAVVERGKPMTRISISHKEGLRADVRSVGQGLAIGFEPAEASAAASTPAPAESQAAATPPPPPSEPAAPTSAPAPAVVSEEIGRAQAPAPAMKPVGSDLPSPTARAEVAHLLEEVKVSVGPAREVRVSLLGDGTLASRDFVLENPPRLVIDLPGVKNQVRHRVFPVQSDLVSRVRVSQFQSAPEPVTRVVLDLAKSAPHAVVPEGERLTVVVGNAAASLEQPAPKLAGGDLPSPPAPSRTTVAEPPAAAPVETVAAAPAPAPIIEKPAPVIEKPAPAGE
ncbi:MAG TPA: AMIN domain-containing protein, partial [Thermoanaerobaculia bacterium]|nr:AMIN domain-containing protein [Thermoanaerobaculia bacterium]